MSKKKAEPVKRIMVFKGLGDSAGKKAYVWLRLESVEHVLKPYEDRDVMLVYSKQIQKRATAGAVYEIPEAEDGRSVLVDRGSYLGRYADEEKVAEWQADHHSCRRMFEEKGKVAKELKERLDLRRLEPFRRLYWEGNATKQAHLLALIYQAVTSRRELK